MKKTWDEILKSAQPVVDFLSSDSFFSRPYDGDRERFIVTTSPEEVVGRILESDILDGCVGYKYPTYGLLLV